jgi:hypothetical protein
MDDDIEETSAPFQGNSGRAGTLQIKKGMNININNDPGDLESWRSVFAVLHDSTQKLYIYDKPDSLQAIEIIELKGLQQHPIDDSVWQKSFCFQLVALSPTYDYTIPARNLNAKIIFLAAETSSEKIEWIEDMNASCNCCSQCRKYYEDLDIVDSSVECGLWKLFQSDSFKSSQSSLVPDSTSPKLSRKKTLHGGVRESPKPIRKESHIIDDTNNSNTKRLLLRKQTNSHNSSMKSINRSDSVTSAPRVQVGQDISKRSLKISLSSLRGFDIRLGKDVGSIKATKFYCDILSDNIIFARTPVSSLDEMAWGEEYVLEFIPPCHQNIQVLLYASSDNAREWQAIGYASYKYENFESGARTDLWTPITMFPDLKNIKVASKAIPEIRISMIYLFDEKMTNSMCSAFIELLIEPDFSLVKMLDGMIGKEREEFAKAFVNILVSQQCEVEGLIALLKSEVASTDNHEILFRGNSITTKAIDYYMKLVGGDFLFATLSTVVDTFYTLDECCEVDPSKLKGKSDDAIQKNIKKLLDNAGLTLNEILTSDELFPPELAMLFAALKKSSEAKFAYIPDVPYTAISGFLFLRFFCPAILSV